MASVRIADEALTGFAKSSLYDQHRPSYSNEAVERLLTSLRVAGVHAASILDLAAGTGKFTDVLAQRSEKFNICAVEPRSEMRTELERKSFPNVIVKGGLAKSIPLEEESVDAVIAAQAFHWFANEDALREIHRVLKPYGTFGMVWNIEDYNQSRDAMPTTSWEGRLRDFVWDLPCDQPRFRHGEWRKVFEDQLKSTPLSITVSADPLFALPLGEDQIKWTVWLSKGNIWKRFRTLGQIAVLEGEALEKAQQFFDDVLEYKDVEKNGEGEVALHGVTYLAWTSKVPA